MNNKAVDYSVDIYQLHKSFEKSGETSSYSTLKSLFLGSFQKQAKDENEYINAIKDLTIRIPKGASVGIIGRNGSGKSTLLKLITGIYRPDSGYVDVRGRVAALIELGAGFHPDFTGRENLYLGGVLHGLSKKEINSRLEEIISFAELEDFIDQPVRTYSSGMFMRLGFSLAVNTDPDILLIDEVLAVGDARFVGKCQEKISDLRRQGKTLFMVSHDLAAIERWSDEVIWLEKGVVRDRGEPRRVIDHYLEYIEKGDEEALLAKERVAKDLPTEVESEKKEMEYERWGSREVEITEVKTYNNDGKEHLLFHTGEPVIVNIKYNIVSKHEDLVFGFGITRADGVNLIGTNTDIDQMAMPELKQTGDVNILIPSLNLQQGTYYLDVAAHRKDGYAYDYHKNVLKFNVRSNKESVGLIDTQHTWTFS